MAKHPSEDTQVLRLLLKDALAKATEPLQANEIAETIQVDPAKVSLALAHLSMMQNPPFPCARVHIPRRGRTWFYYDPTVLDPPDATDTSPPINAVNQDLRFDPLPESLTSTPSVQVPPDVRAITLTLAGVTIKIELSR